MIKVLLISPMDPKVPGDLKFLMGGESTYTKTLLKYPAQKIEYIHYSEALKKGFIEYLPLQKILSLMVKFRILPVSSGSLCFRIKANFDLVHCHSFSLKLDSYRLPIVLSDSSSNFLFLRDYLKWPIWRIKIGFVLKAFLFKILGIIDPDINLGGAYKLITFSNFSKKVHERLGIEKNKIMVITPGLPFQKKVNLGQVMDKKTINILFAGVWFERKGGPLLLEAFKLLNKKFDNIKLIILGPVPKKYTLPSNNVFQKDYVPYRDLMIKFYPKVDILVLVPPLAEGYGLVVEEAASFGIPAVVSNVYALPEIVEDGKTGFVIEAGNLSQLISRMEILIGDSNLRLRMGEEARKRFINKFSVEIMNKRLVKVYLESLKYRGIR